MGRPLRQFLFLSLPIIIFFLSVSALARTPGVSHARVARVIDGDSLVLSDGRELRYIGIDAPETDGNNRPQPFAQEAMLENKRLLEGRVMRLEYDLVRRDKYNRVLAYVFADGNFVNAELLRKGLALLYIYPPNERYLEKLLLAQREARENKRGIWQDVGRRITPSDSAQRHIGETLTVEGVVARCREKEKVWLLDFEGGGFRVVIYRDMEKIFAELGIDVKRDYINKRVGAYGLIKEYKGAVEIVVHDPWQLSEATTYGTKPRPLKSKGGAK